MTAKDVFIGKITDLSKKKIIILHYRKLLIISKIGTFGLIKYPF